MSVAGLDGHNFDYDESESHTLRWNSCPIWLPKVSTSPSSINQYSSLHGKSGLIVLMCHLRQNHLMAMRRHGGVLALMYMCPLPTFYPT